VREENRLASEADFRRVRHQGRSWAHPLLVLHARRSDSPHFRLGVSVGKRLGNAVNRNRVRRRIRELVRARLKELQPGWDVVIVARSSAASAKFLTLGEALDQLIERARLRSPSSASTS
jgi:ribonuclease P protein component